MTERGADDVTPGTVGEPDTGVEPAWGALPALSPEYPGDTPVPRRDRWYRRPTSLITSASLSMSGAGLLTVALLLAAPLIEEVRTDDGFDEFLAGVILLLVFGPVAVVGAVLLVVGAVAAIPLGAVYLQRPDREAGPGVMLILMVLSWAALAVTLVLLL